MVMRPKLKPYIDLMKEKISKRIGVNIDDVGVKATTNEKLGAEGREEGICCHTVDFDEILMNFSEFCIGSFSSVPMNF